MSEREWVYTRIEAALALRPELLSRIQIDLLVSNGYKLSKDCTVETKEKT